MKHASRFVVPALAVSFFIAGTALAQAPSPAAFGSRMRTALDVTPVATTPPPTPPPTLPIGTSEPVTVPTATDTSAHDPYNAGHDATGGIVAAGGAILAAIVIILLFGVIASSRHDQE